MTVTKLRFAFSIVVLAHAACVLDACGGELQGDVDAEASFDIDAHWGECCDYDLGPIPNPEGVHDSSACKHKAAWCVNGYCGVKRDNCLNDDTPPICHARDQQPFMCCGNYDFTLHADAHGPNDPDSGIDPFCLPLGLDDGSGLPLIDAGH